MREPSHTLSSENALLLSVPRTHFDIPQGVRIGWWREECHGCRFLPSICQDAPRADFFFLLLLRLVARIWVIWSLETADRDQWGVWWISRFEPTNICADVVQRESPDFKQQVAAFHFRFVGHFKALKTPLIHCVCVSSAGSKYTIPFCSKHRSDSATSERDQRVHDRKCAQLIVLFWRLKESTNTTTETRCSSGFRCRFSMLAIFIFVLMYEKTSPVQSGLDKALGSQLLVLFTIIVIIVAWCFKCCVVANIKKEQFSLSRFSTSFSKFFRFCQCALTSCVS